MSEVAIRALFADIAAEMEGAGAQSVAELPDESRARYRVRLERLGYDPDRLVIVDGKPYEQKEDDVATALEQQVAEAQEAHDEEIEADGAAHDEPEATEEGKQGELIDRSAYEREDLKLDKVDGNQVDRISLKFSGTVFLDRSDPADIALYRRLALGRDVTLMVEGRCNRTGAEGATDREGDLDVVVGAKGVKVHTVYIATADGLEAAGGEEPKEAQAA